MGKTFAVDAFWDPEAEVWVATSEDVPGLATEASEVEALTAKLHVMIPEMLEANDVEHRGPIRFELVTRQEEQIRLAS